MPARIDIPIIVNLLFLQHIQISMSRPRNINVFQWSGECFFLRHVALYSWFRCGVTMNRTKIAAGSASSVGSASWDSSDSPWNSHWDLRSSQFVPNLKWFLAIRSLFLRLLLSTASAKTNSSFFVWSILPSCWFSEDEYFMHPTFYKIFQGCHQNISFPNSSRDQLKAKKDSGAPKRYYWPFDWFSKSSLIRRFPVCQEVLDVSLVAKAFQRVRPPLFIKARLQQYCWRTFLHSSDGSFSGATRLGSMRCWNAVIPLLIFTRFATNSNALSVYTTFGLCDGSKNFDKLLSESCEVLVLHG